MIIYCYQYLPTEIEQDFECVLFHFFRWILWSWQKVFCAFYNQNLLNKILLRHTLANSGRIADIAEIRLENHSEKERIEVK